VPQNQKALLLKPNYIIGFVGAVFSNYWLFSVSKFVAEPKQLEARMKCLLHKKT
jgi:hypothetical protein